jgi:hypothetical protein
MNVRAYGRWKCHVPGGAPGLQIRCSSFALEGEFDSHTLPPCLIYQNPLKSVEELWEQNF